MHSITQERKRKTRRAGVETENQPVKLHSKTTIQSQVDMSKTSNLKRIKQLRNWYDNEFKHCKSPKRNVSKKKEK